MVVGDRLSSTYYTQNKRPFHNFGNDLVRFCTNHLFGGKIKDIMTGYRAFSYQFVKTYPVLSRGFEIETEGTINYEIICGISRRVPRVYLRDARRCVSGTIWRKPDGTRQYSQLLYHCPH